MAKKMFIAAFLFDEEAFRGMTGEKTLTKGDIANMLANQIGKDGDVSSITVWASVQDFINDHLEHSINAAFLKRQDD